jgi:transposase-like protein
MALKTEFVRKARHRGANIAALCREYGISRQAGCKWIQRAAKEGLDGLEERSRRPHSVPLGTAEEIVVAIVEERKKRPRWGPIKLRALLVARFGDDAPSERTIARVIRRFGQVVKRAEDRSKRTRGEAQRDRCRAERPVDSRLQGLLFKGYWLSRDRTRCEPLTVRDAFSKYLLCVQLVDPPSLEQVLPRFKALFARYGVPKAIQCDNGSPFISMNSRGGLTRLSAWWIALGVRFWLVVWRYRHHTLIGELGELAT